jgi:hypothetical protein
MPGRCPVKDVVVQDPSGRDEKQQLFCMAMVNTRMADFDPDEIKPWRPARRPPTKWPC